jgi:hypothetical protein
VNGTPSFDADNPDDVANGASMEIYVSGPDDINRLYVFTGTAMVNFERPSDVAEGFGTETTTIQVILQKNLPSKKNFRGSATFASHGAIAQDDFTDDYGMGVLEADTIVKEDGELRVIIHLEVAHDARISRVAYQSNVIASVPD